MLPIIQFDPASLAIFAEGPTMALDQDASRLVEATMRGDIDALSQGFEALGAGETAGRTLQLTSAFLHEKRHFLDFAATNYGAFRFRQFQEIYANLPTILHSAQELGRLCLPLEVYLDPVRRRVLGIDATTPEIMAIAQALAKRRRMIEKDRQPHSSRFGAYEIGGEAQLEALAYTAQSRFVEIFAGVDAHDAFTDFVFDRERFEAKYQAFIRIGVAAGIVPVRKLEELEGRADGIGHKMHLDVALLECAIFASLQTDYHTPDDALGAGQVSPSYPAERFAIIATRLAQDHRTLCEATDGLHWGECWEAVDAVCKSAFGRRIHEEMAASINHETERRHLVEQTEDETLIGLNEDYLELRAELCLLAAHSPSRVASTEYFARSAGREVDPVVVLVSSAGEIGEVSDGYIGLMSYNGTEQDGDDRPWRRWWWAAALEQSETKPPEDVLGLARPSNVYSVIDAYAPLAKLILNGRKVRTLIGPELIFAEQRYGSGRGVTFSFYPGFAFPDDEIPEDVLRFIRLDDDLVCDYSNAIVPAGEATVLTPWALRRYPDLARFTIRHLGGTDMAYHTFVRDWSHWVVSKDAMEQMRPLLERELPAVTGDDDFLWSASDEVLDSIEVPRVARAHSPETVEQLARHIGRHLSP